MPAPWPERTDLDVAEGPPLDRLGHPVRPDPRGWDRSHLLESFLHLERGLLDQLRRPDPDQRMG